MAEFNIAINRKHLTVTADDPNMPLLWVLRDLLGMTGTKFGCGVGLCGACTVQLNGVSSRSCQIALAAVGDQSVTTIEGLAPDQTHLHALQQAWIAEDVPECGYCQPGQLMAAAALLIKTPVPTDADIDVALAGNLCRCGTYQRIRRAIHRAAQEH